MRVISLQAENFKILKAIDIRPGEGPVVIGGKNEQGKSSVMDAIWVALAGRAVAPPQPIREGEEECRIVLDIGEYIVSRTFTAKDGGSYTDRIKLLDDRGRIVPSPQGVLNDLLGAIGFDPFEFTKLKAEDQAERLLGLVPLPIDLEEFDLDDKRDYATRRDKNRDADQVEAQLRAIPPEEVPEEAPDRNELVEALGNAADTNAAINAEQARREAESANIGTEQARIDAARRQAEELRRQADQMIADADEDQTRLEARTKALDEAPPLGEFVDTDAIRQQIRDADEVMAKIERQNRRKELQSRLDALRAESAEFTKAMEDREKKRQDALTKARMPVEGLGFAVNEKGKPVVTWNGLPFSQASTAAQIKASTAIAMAGNPDLRILRIKDGSLLDENTMKLVADMAEAEDFQLWVEVVGEGDAGIIIENGEVKGAPPVEQAEGEDKPKAKKAAKKDADKPDGALL